MIQYQTLLDDVLTTGRPVYNERTGITCIQKIGVTTRYDVSRDDFPMLSLRELNFQKMMAELIWYISGERQITEFKKHASFWNAWADKNDRVQSAYGRFWRHYPCQIDTLTPGEPWIDWENQYWHLFEGEHCVDQLAWALDQVAGNPSSRRIIVNAWHPANAMVSNLAPCHDFFQFHVYDGILDVTLYQRSNDLAIGTPFNVATYGGMLLMVAEENGLQPGEFIHMMGNAHIYENQIDAVVEMLKRSPQRDPVRIKQLPDVGVLSLEYKHIPEFQLENYEPGPPIKIPVAV